MLIFRLFLLCTARVVTDRVSGYSKGFGFVRYATLAEAAEGIKGMDGKVSWHFKLLVHLYNYVSAVHLKTQTISDLMTCAR